MSKQNSPKTHPLDQAITAELENMRPYIQADGGDISYKCFHADSGTVEVCMHGACVGCPISAITLQDGVLERLKIVFPQVKAITIAPETFRNLDTYTQ